MLIRKLRALRPSIIPTVSGNRGNTSVLAIHRKQSTSQVNEFLREMIVQKTTLWHHGLLNKIKCLLYILYQLDQILRMLSLRGSVLEERLKAPTVVITDAVMQSLCLAEFCTCPHVSNGTRRVCLLSTLNQGQSVS